MTLKEIIDIEERKATDDLYKIHFINENGWWRAYEWSAYLCQNFPCNLKPSERLKVTHKQNDKIENGIVLVGLMLSSFGKYLPSVEAPNITSNHFIVDAKTIFTNTDFSIDTYKQQLNEWKNSFPYKTESKKQTNTAKTTVDTTTLTAVMQEILAYPLECKSPLDNTMYISDLKNKLLKLL